MKRLLAMLLLASIPAWADTWITFGGVSDHFCHGCGLNNVNPGLGIEYDRTDHTKIIAGSYLNSYNRTTVYAGAAYQPIQYGPARFGIVGGVATNYGLKVPVIAAPVVSVEYRDVGVNILAVPSIGNYSGLVTINFKIKF